VGRRGKGYVATVRLCVRVICVRYFALILFIICVRRRHTLRRLEAKWLHVESVETKERRYPFGQNPNGYLVITADRLITVLTGEGRKPPKTDDERASSFKTMIAYSGLYRIEDNRLTTSHSRLALTPLTSPKNCRRLIPVLSVIWRELIRFRRRPEGAAA
jgi:hypothetical protein